MTIEVVNSGAQPFYSHGECVALQVDELLPPRTSVWLATCVDHLGLYSTARKLLGVAGAANASFQTYVTTLAFAGIAVQVVTTKAPPEITPHLPLTASLRLGGWDRVLMPIWPPAASSGVTIPIDGLDGHRGLDALDDRFHVEGEA